MSELGDLLLSARRQKGWTQAELAFKVGIKDTYIHKLERYKQRGSYATLIKLAIALDLPPDLVLAKAGFPVSEARSEKLEFELEDYQFSRLHPKVKKLMLEIAEHVSEYLES